MAPRTRTKTTKVLKENVDVVKKTKALGNNKITKPPRKALADKTNSLSDDNASIDVPIKTKTATKYKAAKSAVKTVSKDDIRPRRDRRLPTRYVENKVLNNLSNSKEIVKNQESVTSISDPIPKKLAKNAKAHQPPPVKDEVNVVANRPKRNGRLQSDKDLSKKPETPRKQNQTNLTSPFKTPSQNLDSSLIANRPKRICRLPSKFEDHSISPSKFIPVQPCHASTPLIEKTRPQTKDEKKENSTKPGPVKRQTRKNKEQDQKNINNTKGIEHYLSKSHTNTSITKDKASSPNKPSPDTNNNPKRILPRKVVSTKSPKKQPSFKANIKTGFAKRILEKSLSFRVFEDRKSQDKDKDVYEFTYDPNEEPPQKKKRKKVVKRRPPKPKTVVLKNNYDKNLQKAIESLKSKVKPSQFQNPAAQSAQPFNVQSQKIQPANIQPQKQPAQNVQKVDQNAGKIHILEDIIIKPATENKTLTYTPALPVNDSAKSIHMSNYASIHIEDIAADFEENDNDMNYSPVNSPCRPKTPEVQRDNTVNDTQIAVNSKDPLNLQGDNSFFEDQPVASSSMNISIRHPLASPWRVEFSNLPIRWQANTYVKPNMTPAVESSFINSEEISKKKHVYTNIVAEEPLPQIEDPPNLKQTSIISFMKEVAERSLKKKRGRSVSPTKANSLFEDVSDPTKEFGYKTPKKARKENAVATPNSSNNESCEGENSNNENHENTIGNHENDNEVSNENTNPKENSNQSDKSSKKSRKDKDGTFFGFDESENYDQENVSPIKNLHHTRARGLRSKSRAVLKEINAMSGPTRAVLPVTAKAKLPSSEVVEKLYDQLKSAEVAPQFMEKEKGDVTAATNDELSDDDESVHLFEDIEIVHHTKAHRKSYGKAKKVTFRQPSNSDSDTQTQIPEVRSSDEDDLGDLTFQMPNVKQKKVTKKKKKTKKQLSKKEEKQVEEWAAGFNSMCEDIDEFPLVVE